MDLTILILTRDEALNLPHCLASLAGCASNVLVVDSGSSDDTCAIAEEWGCTVVRHQFQTHSDQVNWAADYISGQLPATSWIMRLDADERLTPELAAMLEPTTRAVSAEVNGIWVRRRIHFLGRWIRHGGVYPNWVLRIWRAGHARSEERWMDEHMVLLGGKSTYLKADIVDDDRKGLAFWIEKHNWYSGREVLDLAGRRRSRSPEGPTGRRRWLKNNVYLRSPLFVRAAAYWAYRYILRLGFLDGIPGLVFHTLQAFWYRFLVDAKLTESRLATQAGRQPGDVPHSLSEKVGRV